MLFIMNFGSTCRPSGLPFFRGSGFTPVLMIDKPEGDKVQKSVKIHRKNAKILLNLQHKNSNECQMTLIKAVLNKLWKNI